MTEDGWAVGMECALLYVVGSLLSNPRESSLSCVNKYIFGIKAPSDFRVVHTKDVQGFRVYCVRGFVSPYLGGGGKKITRPCISLCALGLWLRDHISLKERVLALGQK